MNAIHRNNVATLSDRQYYVSIFAIIIPVLV